MDIVKEQDLYHQVSEHWYFQVWKTFSCSILCVVIIFILWLMS
jgi:hypothetical protein